jgi:Na+-transporting methylmalonyl-CoA/oxaloacetate decarboxylase gamma subunit
MGRGKELLEPFRTVFNEDHFSELFLLIWVAAAIGLIVTVVLYNVRSRQLHRHEPLRTMQEWLLWTGMTTFGLILVGALFHFYFLFILIFIVTGITAFIWVRFYRFPPYIQAYNEQLRRARFFSQARHKQAESTVRTRRSRNNQRRRRR